ncbi:MAG TPA: hypothetical protein VER32_15260 [Pyrinomonadaceae bacterium]|nr:hypothetical protein [Pyrinomonadaceae bacterium]
METVGEGAQAAPEKREGAADGGAAARVTDDEASAASAQTDEAAHEEAAPVLAARGTSEAGRRVALLLLGALAIGVAFWWMQFSTRSICCGDFDAYYHFRWSQMLLDGMRSGDFPPAFEALPLTTLNRDDYVDHHFLFHVLQIPFTQFGDTEAWAAVVFALCLLLSPLVYRLAARLLRGGDTVLVPIATAVMAGFAVAMALLQVRASAAARYGVAALALAVMFGCERLVAYLVRRGGARAAAVLAAAGFALFVPLLFYWATVLYQIRTGAYGQADWHADFHYGAKLGTWLFASAAVFACYWVVVRYRLRYPVVWLLALLGCSTPFLYRMNMGKAMSVSIVLLVVGIHLLFQRKYIWLLPLSFLFALTYDMFALLGVAAVVWAAVIFWSERRIEWRPVAWVAAGSIAGFVINPYFPQNFMLMYDHVAMKVTSKDFSTAVGGEWYPYDTWEFLGNCFVATVAQVVGYIAFNGSDRKSTQRTLFLLLFSTLLMIVNARWKRFSEYWPPFAVLFAAFSLQPYLEGARAYAARLPADVLDELQPFLDRHERPAEVARRRRERMLEYGLASLAAVALGFAAVWCARVTSGDIRGMAGPEQYRGGMEWIAKNVPEGEIIFNTDWDDFPKLFFYSPRHAYASGLDPTYLHDRNRQLSDLYGDIGTGKVEDPGPPIRERFGARYVFTDNEHENFVSLALDSGWFDEVYADDNCTVLRIRDARGEPAPLPAGDDPAAHGADDAPPADDSEPAPGDEEGGGEEPK